jgi:hypothetical protein
LAAAALAMSAIHIGYSQDLRPYSLVVLFTLLSVYCLLVAERTGARKWWLAFVLASVVDLYLSYFALTLVLPAVVLFVVWPISFEKGSNGNRYAMFSFLAVALAAIPVLVDAAAVPRDAPDWRLLTPSLILAQYTAAFTQLTKIGVSGWMEAAIQWLFVALALLGVVFGVRGKKWAGVILCLSFMLLPSLLLAIFRTSNSVFQRYILFTLPFYLLLIANGTLGLWNSIARPFIGANRARIGKYALVIIMLLPFVYSLWVYFDHGQYRMFGSQPDYRGVSRYLASVAHADDIILVADEPALGTTVLRYYWDGHPPAALYDARDPRLPSAVQGSLYVVVSFFQNDSTFLDRLSAPANNWADVQRFERVIVLKSQDNDARVSLDYLVGLLEAENANFQPVLTLRGSILQSSDAISQAASAYQEAGRYFGTGDEYLSTANGYLQRGERDRAWREALISKFMLPANPAIHEWMAGRLEEDGRFEEARIEAELARLLGVK